MTMVFVLAADTFLSVPTALSRTRKSFALHSFQVLSTRFTQPLTHLRFDLSIQKPGASAHRDREFKRPCRSEETVPIPYTDTTYTNFPIKVIAAQLHFSTNELRWSSSRRRFASLGQGSNIFCLRFGTLISNDTSPTVSCCAQAR